MKGHSYQITLPLLAEADAEARRFGHEYLGPEHLLLAVATQAQAASRSFFDRHGITANLLRESIGEILGPTSSTATAGDPLRLTLRSHVALAHAIGAASRRGDSALSYTPDELLGGLLTDEVATRSIIETVLIRAGITPAEARAELLA